jgi:hypothetical protein
VRVVLVGEPDAMGLGGESELGGVAVEHGRLGGRGDRDLAIEVVGLEQLAPELFRVEPDRLHLDAGSPPLGREHLDRLGEIWALQSRTANQSAQNLLNRHEARPSISSRHHSQRDCNCMVNIVPVRQQVHRNSKGRIAKKSPIEADQQ